MVSVVASSAVVRGFEHGSVLTIKCVCVATPLSTHHYGERAKAGWLGIRISCPSGESCLSAGCCFSELAL